MVAPADDSVEFVEELARNIIDMRRGLDYVETRCDLDMSRIAFLEASAIGRKGMLMPAIETRYRSVALWGAGLGPEATVRYRTDRLAVWSCYRRTGMSTSPPAHGADNASRAIERVRA
jgi:hypothetical protein